MKNIWIPTLCAIVLAGGIYWYAGKDNGSKDDFKSGVEVAPLQFGSDADQMQGQQETSQTDKPAVVNTAINSQKIMSATFQTNLGVFTIEFNDETPNTVANFVKLAKEGFYDGTKFHRVIKGFMNQGGDPLSKDDGMMDRWGTGGPGYKFADEISQNNSNDVGTIAMANAGPSTNGSQFFVNVAANNFLDEKHTVFGKVTNGLDVVMAINSVPTQNDRPVKPVILQSITLK